MKEHENTKLLDVQFDVHLVFCGYILLFLASVPLENCPPYCDPLFPKKALLSSEKKYIGYEKNDGYSTSVYYEMG